MRQDNSKTIIQKNLELMLTYDKPGGMHYLISNESMGGNAGFEGNRPCLGTNFYFDKEGEIKYFGNIQNVPGDIVKNNYHATFRLSCDTFRTWKCRIIDTYFDGRISRKAKKNLQSTVEEYNLNQGF